MLNKYFLIIGILLTTIVSANADIGFDINAGDLTTEGGSNALPTGSLVLLIASPTGSFSTSLAAGEFVSGNEVILAAFASNNNLDGNNATSDDPIVTTATLTSLEATTGESLALEWFSGITYAQYEADQTTTASDTFGLYAGSTTGSSNGGSAWVLPADGTITYSINFITQSLNTTSDAGLTDAELDSLGQANYAILTVPEPSTIALTGLFGVGMLLLFRRRRNLSLLHSEKTR